MPSERIEITIIDNDASANQAPNGIIDSPAGNVQIQVGDTVSFAGTGVDPDGDAVSFSWTLNGVVFSTDEDPGNLAFNETGQFNVALTVTDSQGLADPTPATVVVTVSDVLPPPPPPPVPDITGLLQGFALTPPQRAVAATIEIICPPGGLAPDLQRDCNALVTEAMSANSAARTNDDRGVSEALADIAPDQANAPADASQNSVTTQAQNVGKRLGALRGGARLSVSGLTLNMQDGRTLTGEQLASLYDGLRGQSGGAAAADEGVDFGPIGIFINGAISFGDKDETDNESGFDFDTKGITVGADYRFNDSFVLGAAFGYTNTDLDLDANGGELDTDGYSFTLYGTFYQGDQFYMDGLVSYGYNDFDQDRNITYSLSDVDLAAPGAQTTVSQTLSADYDGDQWDISIGGGYNFNRGGLTFGPVGRLEYIKTDVDGYRETAPNNAPGSGWTVEIDDQEFESLTLSLGGQASYAISQSWGVLLPQARLEWVHEFDDDPLTISGRFVGDPNNTSFSFLTDSEDENYFNVGIGAAAVFARGRSAFIEYQGVFGFEDLEHHSVNLGVRLEF